MLGVGGVPKAPMVVLEVENDMATEFLRSLRILGESIPMIVNHSFAAPDAYAF